MRVPSKTSAGSSAVPLSSISATSGATRSMNVLLPGSVHRNTATVVDEKVTSPAVRSSVTSYDSTSSRRARAWASSRVMFMRVLGLGTDEAPRADARAAGRGRCGRALQKDMESSHGQERPAQRE